MAKAETEAPSAENTVKLKDHPDLEGVAIYFCTADERYYYSRNGKRFSPKGGDTSHGCAEVSAEDAYVRAQASKRVAPQIRMSVYAPAKGKTGVGAKGPKILGPGYCRGYSLQSGREGLVFETDPVPSKHKHRPPETETYYLEGGDWVSDSVMAFHPDDPATGLIRDLCRKIEHTEKRLRWLERMRSNAVSYLGLKLPAAPESKERRVRIEEELVETCRALAMPALRLFKFHLAERVDGYDQLEPPKRWSNAQRTSAWGLLATDFADGIWELDWVTTKDDWRGLRHRQKWEALFPGEVVYCFKRFGMPKVRLLVRDVKPPSLSEVDDA